MKKSISRVIAILLCLAMVFSFAACKKEKTGKVDIDDLKAVDLKGREIVFVSWGNALHIYEDSQDEKMQTYAARMNEMEGLYNCNFVFKKIAAGEILSTFTAGEMGGQPLGDFVQMKQAWIQTCYDDKNLLDLSKYFDGDMPQFFQYSVNAFKEENGSFYSIAFYDYQPSNVIYFNKDMFEERGIDIQALYKDVKDKKWTMDKFFEIGARLAVVKDGVYETYAAYAPTAGDPLQNWHAPYKSNFVVKNADGKYESGLKTAELRSMLENVKKMHDSDFIMKKRPGDNWETEYKLFKAGTIGFNTGNGVAHLTQIKTECTFEFGVLPFPLAKEGDDYSATAMAINSVVMPKSLDKDEKTAKAIADMVTYIYQPVYDKMEDQLRAGYEMNTYDEESVENLITIAGADSIYVPIHSNNSMTAYNSTVAASLNKYFAGEITYDAFIAATDSAWTAKINEFFGQ